MNKVPFFTIYLITRVISHLNISLLFFVKVASFQGELLKLWKISRTEMGAYMCIASNGVPPTISKRIIVNVHCKFYAKS